LFKWDRNGKKGNDLMNEHDRQLRGLYLAFFSGVILLIFLWTGHAGVIVLGLFLVPLLSFGLPLLMNLMSGTFVSLIYGFGVSAVSYENGLYQNDMDKAKRLIREEKWIQAITAYRKIIQKVPNEWEPRFNLARIYQKVGLVGLAMGEYHKIIDSKNKFGPNHGFVLESRKATEELRQILSTERSNYCNKS